MDHLTKLKATITQAIMEYQEATKDFSPFEIDVDYIETTTYGAVKSTYHPEFVTITSPEEKM